MGLFLRFFLSFFFHSLFVKVSFSGLFCRLLWVRVGLFLHFWSYNSAALWPEHSRVARLSLFMLTLATFWSDDSWQSSTVLFLETTATHCNSLQLTATHCNSRATIGINRFYSTGTQCKKLKNTASHCSTPQQTCNKRDQANRLYPTTTHCNSVRHTATHLQQ